MHLSQSHLLTLLLHSKPSKKSFSGGLHLLLAIFSLLPSSKYLEMV